MRPRTAALCMNLYVIGSPTACAANRVSVSAYKPAFCCRVKLANKFCKPNCSASLNRETDMNAAPYPVICMYSFMCLALGYVRFATVVSSCEYSSFHSLLTCAA
eukprot:12134-Heterococcus_DN1.PRE.2